MGPAACGTDREWEHPVRRENHGKEHRVFRFGRDALTFTSEGK